MFSKGQLTSGRAYKLFAEGQHDFLATVSNKQFVFAGFNALSKAELVTMKRIIDAKKGLFLTDSDLLYLDDSLHEAGNFLRKNREFLGVNYTPEPLNKLVNKKLDVKIIECAQHIGQVKVAANELSKLSTNELNKTLVLLCDEALIGSMINHIPKNVAKTNLTLGLPLNQTAVKSWVDLLFQIQENKVKFQTDSIYFYDLQRFINHSFTISSLHLNEVQKLGEVERDAIQYNKIFQNISSLPKSNDLNSLCALVFEKWEENWSKAPVSYTHLTLPTKPKV